jgi:hypothetical protein
MLPPIIIAFLVVYAALSCVVKIYSQVIALNTQDTYFLAPEGNTGAWIIIISFDPGEAPDKEIILQIEDTVTDELLDPPRPWKYSAKTILVRNGYATEVRYSADIDQ